MRSAKIPAMRRFMIRLFAAAKTTKAPLPVSIMARNDEECAQHGGALLARRPESDGW